MFALLTVTVTFLVCRRRHFFYWRASLHHFLMF